MPRAKHKKVTLSHIGEFGFIDTIRKQFPLTSGVHKGIGDDTAVMASGKNELSLLTTDMLVQGNHFTKGMKARDVGHKALACSLSDIAAMGGYPLWAVVSIGMPADLDIRYVGELYEGIKELAKKFKVGIVGGDTVRSREVVINVALIGQLKKKHLVLRSGAKTGDRIFVTGPLGRSLKTGKHLTFIPRLKESQALVNHFKPSSMIDVSDGLVSDLDHLLHESNVGAVLFSEQIPKASRATLMEALYDGEDFELLFTLSKHKSRELSRLKRYRNSFYQIGEIKGRKGSMILMDKKGNKEELTLRGYRHFK